jgi:hypothetical protein
MSELKLNTTGSGTLGNLEAGWSEQEFATPINPDERAGGTGSVTYTGADTGESVLLINAAVVASTDTLGDVSGVIRSTSKTGQRVACSQDTKLAPFNAIRNMPPMGSANPFGVMSLAEQILGITNGSVFMGSSGTYWSLAGHTVGFDSDNNIARPGQDVVNYSVYNNSTGLFNLEKTTTYQNYVAAESFDVFNGLEYAQNVSGGSFVLFQPLGLYLSTDYPETKLRLMGKTILDGDDLVFTFNGKPQGPSGSDYEFLMTGTIDYSANNIILNVEYRSAGIITTTTSTVSIASLNKDAEMAFRFYFSTKPLTASPYSRFEASFSVCNTSDYFTVIQSNVGFTPDFDPVWYDPWEINGNVRAIWERTDQGGTSSLLVWPSSERQDWENNAAYNFVESGTFNGPGKTSIGFVGPVWDWLQQFCSAYNYEIGLENDTPIIRPIGTQTLDITNVAGSPTINPVSTFTGRSMDIQYHQGQIVSSGEVYNAEEDDNRVLSVGAAQETVTKLQTNAYLTSVLNPTRTTALIPPAGTYYVIDSTGLPLVADQWEDYGGNVQVTIDPDEAGVLNVTLSGPREEIPSTTAPYSLAISDGTNEYAALSILGSGVVANPEVLNLLTGADPENTPTEVASTVNNVFISTLAQAYDGGVWSTVDASGPRVTLTATVPTEIISGFGATAGSLVNYYDSTYRITDATIRRTATDITAVRHVTVGSFDDAWSGQLVQNHDLIWDAYKCKDQKIFTYKGTPASTA